jgi:mannose-6-phosphate isomerase-like protein (cupin superfamily)
MQYPGPPKGLVLQLQLQLPVQADSTPALLGFSINISGHLLGRTGGALSVFETSIAGGPPLHVHDREDECFYILDGELSVRCGEEAFSAGTGSFVFLPRGRPHRFWAPARPARLLLIVAPAGIEDYFREINSASTDDERHQTGERFGIRVVTGPADGPASAQP